jgi:hypothetical protein
MCRKEFAYLLAYPAHAFFLVGGISAPQDLRRRLCAGRARSVSGFETLHRLTGTGGFSHGDGRLLLSLCGGGFAAYLLIFRG